MLKPHVILSLADLLLCLFLVFMTLFMTAKIEANRANATDPSHFLAEITWLKSSRSDVDIFLRDANGQIVSFQKQESEIASLDTDDKGLQAVDVARREVISIKVLKAGTYVINALLYASRDGHYVKGQGRVTKLSPFAEVCSREFEFIVSGSEVTICEFTIDEAGKVVYVDRQKQSSLVKGN
jgi:hypothetical protein